MRPAWLALGLAAMAAGPVAAQDAAGEVTLVCEAAYLPARTTWTRTVHIGYDERRVHSVRIDGVPVHAFAVRETVILTALDNERIQVDTATRTWTSDFRGLATAQGRCERAR